MTQAAIIDHNTDMDRLGVEPDHERGAFMSVYTGGKFHPLDPHEEDIHIEDIAHALSHQNRFNGHLRWPYTVAQHSVLVTKLVGDGGGSLNAKRYALLHDAAEAYIGDVIRPVKMYLSMFKEVEEKIMTAVAHRFDITMDEETVTLCKQADNLMCAAEKRDLHPTRIEWPGMPSPTFDEVKKVTPWDHSYAKGAFMRKYNELF